MAKTARQLEREINETLARRGSHATKIDRRKIRYVMLSWSDPQSPYPSQRYVEANYPETNVPTILEGLLQRGIPEVYVEDRRFTLASLDDVYKAIDHARERVAKRRR